jgi:hypothetical protein
VLPFGFRPGLRDFLFGFRSVYILSLLQRAELTLQPKLDDIPPSTYKIGKDLPAGEYKLTPTSDTAYWERNSNPRDSVDGIIANDMLSESAYVTVREGEYFKIIGAKGQKVD